MGDVLLGISSFRPILACVLIALGVLAGCAVPTTVAKLESLATDTVESPRIVVMAPDVKYFLLTAGGMPQPQAEWTIAARENFVSALHEFANEREIELRMMENPDELSEAEISYQKLYSAVGSTVLTNHFSAINLPTKNKKFDWSLGPGVQIISDKHQADYALFSYYRDYQASGGRVAFALLAAVAGIGVQMGAEVGFASLVDLHTGEIVWFNRVITGAGELRKADSARRTIDALFKDFPAS